jgi:hypothetical protein
VPTYDTTTGLRALLGSNVINDIDAGFLALAQDVAGRYAEVLTSQNASSATPQDLATVGPSVTITVPSNTLVVVHAEATITGSGTNAGSVYLAEDGAVMLDESNNSFVLLSNAAALATTKYTRSGTVGGTSARVLSSALVFPASAGAHTYKLMYGIGTSAGPFSARKLRVGLRSHL